MKESLFQVRQAFESLKKLQNYKDPNAQKRIFAALKKAVPTIKGARLKKEFISKYSVRKRSKSLIEFTIPKGYSVLDLLSDAHAISLRTTGKVAVYPPRLENWSTRIEFKKKATRAKRFLVQSLVANSEFKTRSEQAKYLKSLKLSQAKSEELAAAHSANFTLDGTDFFEGNIIRVVGNKLYYGDGGLSQMDESDFVNNCRYKNLKAASVVYLD
jgi:hypothetical protein